MVNQRRKGKRGEHLARALLAEAVPDLQRNLGQEREGGIDLVSPSNPDIGIQVKHGKAYCSAMMRKILNQVEAEREGRAAAFAVILPDREPGYAVMDLETLKALLGCGRALTDLEYEMSDLKEAVEWKS